MHASVRPGDESGAFATVACNNLSQVRIHSWALSYASGYQVLTLIGEHLRWRTLGNRLEISGASTRRYVVEGRIGDDALSGSSDPIVPIKIDVEGYECHVLRQLSRTLRTHRPAVIVEVIPTLLANHGYRAYPPIAKRRGLRYTLRFRELAGAVSGPEDNQIWLHPGGRSGCCTLKSD